MAGYIPINMHTGVETNVCAYQNDEPEAKIE